VTLSNIGDASLTVISIVASGDFGQTNDCGTSVAASSSCTINVTFKPTLRGTRTGSVTITDNASGTPHSISLQGTGIGPAATLSPGLTFTGQLVGTTSAAQAVTLSSTGETALAVNSISTTGDFGQTNNCPNSLPNGQNCTIQVTFTPTARGTRNGTLNVTNDSTTSPVSVSLSGKGIAPVVSLSRTSLAFGNQVLDVPVTATVILSNIGDATLVITSITASGDFNQSNDCGASVPAPGQCTITITFKPKAVGARLGTLTLTDSATNSPQSVSLSGTGVQLGFSPPSVSFGDQLVGTSSATQAVTITNPGGSGLTVTGVVPSAGFTQTNNCGTALPANASCTVNIAFSPAASGPANGLVTVSYNGTQSTITVTGNGTDFVVQVPPGSSTTATISAGSTATYNLSLGGSAGFSGAVNITCSGAPAAASCSVNPPSITLSGTTPANFTVMVTTTARSATFPLSLDLRWISPSTLALYGSVFTLAILARRSRSKKLRCATLLAGFGMMLILVGCGGGGGPRPITGTPAGTSTITVSATSGSATRTLNLTLNVN